MKILKIIHGYPPLYNAGSEVYSQSICDVLSEDHQLLVVTREENEYLPVFNFRRERRDQKDFVYINMALGKDGFNHPVVNERFKKLVEEFQPEVAHIGHLNHLSLGMVDVLHLLNIPMVYTLHDFWLLCPRGQFLQRNFDGIQQYKLCDKQDDQTCAGVCYKMYFSGTDEAADLQAWTHWIHNRMKAVKSACRKIDLFIAPSQYLRNRFIEQSEIPAGKIHYLDYGFPGHYLQPTFPVKEHAGFTFGYIGTHIPSKGINLLIEAFGKVQGNARLLIWGRENGQSTMALKKMASDTSENIEFRGEYVNKNLADTVFAKVDCIVVPSIWAENSPLVIHEAQACGIPVITADYGGMSELVSHQVNGLLFRHRDAADLARNMQFAVEHPENLKKMGKRGYLLHPEGKVPEIREHCSELLTMYQSLISNYHEKHLVAHNA